MSRRVSGGDLALLTDLYELTMLQAYWAERMAEPAVFSLFVRRLPPERNYLVACGLASVLDALERLRFDDDDLGYLASLDLFRPAFLDWLRELRFTGDVRAVPEGTVVFADEPLLEVEAPLPQAQFVETLVMNLVHQQTLIASKAARVVTAAAGRAVVDFGLRRMQSTAAAVDASRACYVAGAAATSNVLAGREYGIPVTGTMAHSYIQSHDDERAAFASFAALYPATVLLADTYDTLAGVRRVAELAREPGTDFRVSAVRLDSGDLVALSKRTRAILDEAGLQDVDIFASGGLDEYEVARLLREGAPIDGFGVGTRMGVSHDAPSLDIAYKLTEYAGRGRLKLAAGKPVLPGPKQVFRLSDRGGPFDVVACADEELAGRPLLRPVMRAGERVAGTDEDLAIIRERAREQIAELPESVRSLEPARPGYRVQISERLAGYQQRVIGEVAE